MQKTPSGALRLRNVRASDLPIFFENQLDPEATRMADVPARERAAYMADWHRIMSDRTLILKTIVFDGRVAGNVVSWDQSGRQEVGYWLGREFWGRGIATRALRAFLKHIRPRPLYAHVARHNLASRRVLEKSGFSLYAEDAEEFILQRP